MNVEETHDTVEQVRLRKQLPGAIDWPIKTRVPTIPIL